MEALSIVEARRLSLARAGLLKPAWTGMPSRAGKRGRAARGAALAIIGRFGYLQLDTVSVTGARSHAIVLLSRLDGLDPSLGEELLAPGEPLFEYWGHEASWIPLELYPAFNFRRQEMRLHPWWGDVIGEHPELVERIMQRIEDEGPLRSLDMEGKSGNGWWQLKAAKKVATALWSCGRLAIRERRSFQRSYDLTERVIPKELRESPMSLDASLRTLILRALAGHGWATTGTIAATWRLRNRRREITKALDDLVDAGEIVSCQVRGEDRSLSKGWLRPVDLELADRLRRIRPRRDCGVLLSPFDPVLWDRGRVARLFGFDQILEIFKPAPQRVYGYYCMPVLAGDRLVARVDLKCERKSGRLIVLSRHYETQPGSSSLVNDREATRTAVERYADSLGLSVVNT
jgi:uncharacterized protein YcaQ